MSDPSPNPADRPENPLFEDLMTQAKGGLNPQDVINTVTDGYKAMMPKLQAKLMSRLEEGMENKSLPPELSTMMEDLIQQTLGTAFASTATLFERDPINVTPTPDPDTAPDTANVVAEGIQDAAERITSGSESDLDP